MSKFNSQIQKIILKCRNVKILKFRNSVKQWRLFLLVQLDP